MPKNQRKRATPTLITNLKLPTPIAIDLGRLQAELRAAAKAREDAEKLATRTREAAVNAREHWEKAKAALAAASQTVLEG